MYWYNVRTKKESTVAQSGENMHGLSGVINACLLPEAGSEVLLSTSVLWPPSLTSSQFPHPISSTCCFLFSPLYYSISTSSSFPFPHIYLFYLFIYWTYIPPHSSTSTLRAVYNLTCRLHIAFPPSKLGTHFTNLRRIEGCVNRESPTWDRTPGCEHSFGCSKVV